MQQLIFSNINHECTKARRSESKKNRKRDMKKESRERATRTRIQWSTTGKNNEERERGKDRKIASANCCYEIWKRLKDEIETSNNNNNTNNGRKRANKIYGMCIINRLNDALTLFLHVTWTRYLVSGHRDNSTLAESVNKLPIKPPPKTSHVTRQLMSLFVGSQAKCVATRNSCLIIDAIRNCHWFCAIGWRCDDIALHVSQH